MSRATTEARPRLVVELPSSAAVFAFVSPGHRSQTSTNTLDLASVPPVAGDDPVNSSDPSGECTPTVFDGVVIGVCPVTAPPRPAPPTGTPTREKPKPIIPIPPVLPGSSSSPNGTQSGPGSSQQTCTGSTSTTSIYKAPRSGYGQLQYESGWIPNVTFVHDPTGPDVVHFTLDLERAVNLSHQKEFGDGVIQVSAPTSFLDGNGLEPEPFDINDDISVPYALLPELNTFPRDWASQ